MCKVVELCWRTSKHTEAESIFFWLGTGQSKHEVGLGQRSSLACGEIYQKKKKRTEIKVFLTTSVDKRSWSQEDWLSIFSTLCTVSVSLGKTSICLLWRACIYIFRNIRHGCAEISSSITISLTEGKVLGCPAVRSLSQWKQEKKNMKPVHKLIIMQISNRYPFSHYLKCFLPSVGNKPASGRLPEAP